MCGAIAAIVLFCACVGLAAIVLLCFVCVWGYSCYSSALFCACVGLAAIVFDSSNIIV